MKVINNWRQALRMNSVQAALLLAFLSALQVEVLPKLQAAIPAQYWPYVSAAMALVIVLLRLRAQPGLDEPQGGSK